MRPNCRVALFSAALFAAASSWASTPPSAPPAVKTVRVLFIGNSFTYFNDLPSMFEKFAEATYPNLDVVTEAVTAPGESLEGHWNTGTALKKIQGARWDYVVLQDQGSMPTGSFLLDGKVRRERPQSFFDYGERFARAAVAAKARPVLYPVYEVKGKNDDLPYLDYAYMTLGRKTGSLLAPVERVWHRLHDTQGFDLYAEDGGHPSIHGSYVVAVTLAATLFGEAPPAETVQHPAPVQDGQAQEILAALRAVRAELAPSGYVDVPTPDFVTRPVLESSLPILDPAVNGTWSAQFSALELSLGCRLTLSFDPAAPATPKVPKIEMVDFTLNGAFPLPINDLAVTGNVLRFTTSSQNRAYKLQLVRRADGVEMLVEHAKGKNMVYNHVDYRRNEAAEHFEFLERQYAEISSQTTQEGFDSALLKHYEALTARLGAERLSKVLQGFPFENPWWAILTGWEYTHRGQHDAAVRFLTFATHRFPQSCEAFCNLSEGLEKAGRIEEAYNAILRAETLASPEEPELIAKVQEYKAHLQKLRPAPPAGA